MTPSKEEQAINVIRQAVLANDCKEIARKAGISESWVWKFAHGEFPNAGAAKVMRIAEILGIEISFNLIERNDQ